MKLFSNEFKELIGKLHSSTIPVLITGLAGSGKLFATKRVLQDLNIDFELISDVYLSDIARVYKTISKAPEKTYLLDISDGKHASMFKPLYDSERKHPVSFASKNLNLNFIFTGKIYIVTGNNVCHTVINRCYHIEVEI